MVIDAHSHLFPAAWKSAGHLPPQLFDLETIFERQEEAGVDMTVISDPHIWYGDLDLGSIERTREYNDFVAGLQRDHADRIAALGSVTPWRGPEHVEEAVRVVSELGLVGLAMPTSDHNQYLESVPAEFWEAVGSLGVPIFVHPGGATIGQDLMTDYRLGELCGRPLDMTVTLSRFILWGVYERWPNLRLLCAHAGGAISTVADRLDFGHDLRDYAPLGPWGEVQLGQPPSEFVKKLHFDTVTFGARGLRLALDTVGPRQIHLGSDGPPLPFPISRHIGHIDELGLGSEDREAILGGNTRRLFSI